MEVLDDLERARRSYAEEVQIVSGIRNDAIVEAFAKVPRERFLGPQPWRIAGPDGYREPPDDEVRHAYHNVLFAIDPKRNLNNGQPSFLATLIESAAPGPGQHVVHIGCGSGYYSAILAEMVGEEGIVTAIEIDEEIAERARKNLDYLPQVEVVQGDGTTFDPGAADAFLVNAGATHPAPIWLERLLPGARLVVPLTVTAPLHSVGAVLKVEAQMGGFSARFVHSVGIYPCVGARDDTRSAKLGEAFGRGFAELAAVRSLSIEEHPESDSCWLHTEGFCLSKEPVV